MAFSKYPFQPFASFTNKINLVHHHFPELFLNREDFEVTRSEPQINFEINFLEVENGIFRTNFVLKVSLEISGFEKATNNPLQNKIYDLELEYVAMTMIENAANIPILDVKRILMVDVPYLIFPEVRHLIYQLTTSMKATPVLLNPIDFEQLFQKESWHNEN